MLLPVRVGASWPVAPAAIATRAGDHSGPALRMSSGVDFLQNPARVRRDMTPAVAFTVALDLPLRRGLALALEGEHSSERAAVPNYRQEVDDFGNSACVRDRLRCH